METNFKLQTKLGNVWLTPTQADHIYVDLSSERITIRGVSYHGSLHAYKWADGRWYLGQEKQNDYERLNNALYLRRDNAKNYNDSYPSEPAQKTAIEVILQGVNAWVLANQDELVKAEALHTTKEIATRAARIAELKNHIAALEAEIQNITKD